MKRVSTHVLDMVRGKPAQNVPVRLEKKDDASGVWQLLTAAQTDKDGRCPQLLRGDDDLSAGTYRLIFDTGSYYTSQNIAALFPAVHVTFEARDSDSQFHIPLLLSPNGYTTYRGS